MSVLVVFESMFGNTEAVARAVADGLSARLRLEVVEVGTAPVLSEDVELLVVGGPTHAFGLSRPGTRRSAAEQAKGKLVSAGTGLREWLGAAEARSGGMAAAAFDTRIRRPRLPGSAARAAGRRLQRLGYRLIAAPESFYVAGTPGPLLEGEQDRAHRWGEALGATFTATQPGRIS